MGRTYGHVRRERGELERAARLTAKGRRRERDEREARQDLREARVAAGARS